MRLNLPKYNKSDRFLWADYVELLCLASIDAFISISDVEDRVEPLSKDVFINGDDIEFQNLTQDEKKETFWADVMGICEYRKVFYGETYPFETQNNKLLKRLSLSDKKLFYIYFLMSSHLKYFKEASPVLTGEFEYFSLLGLKEYLGSKALLNIFGKNSTKLPSQFMGTEFERFSALAQIFKEQIIRTKDDFNKYSTGDGGIDIIGTMDFHDNNSSRILISGQCKCQVDWDTNRFSSAERSLQGYMSITQPLINFSFIPYCFRKAGGEWAIPQRLSGVVLVDRQRLINLNAQNLDRFRESNSYKAVKKFINQQEDLV